MEVYAGLFSDDLVVGVGCSGVPFSSPDCLLVLDISVNLVRGLVYRLHSARSLLFG